MRILNSKFSPNVNLTKLNILSGLRWIGVSTQQFWIAPSDKYRKGLRHAAAYRRRWVRVEASGISLIADPSYVNYSKVITWNRAVWPLTGISSYPAVNPVRFSGCTDSDLLWFPAVSLRVRMCKHASPPPSELLHSHFRSHSTRLELYR
jgi:hypothetical protein